MSKSDINSGLKRGRIKSFHRTYFFHIFIVIVESILNAKYEYFFRSLFTFVLKCCKRKTFTLSFMLYITSCHEAFANAIFPHLLLVIRKVCKKFGKQHECHYVKNEKKNKWSKNWHELFVSNPTMLLSVKENRKCTKCRLYNSIMMIKEILGKIINWELHCKSISAY